ncbi:response regulator [candidate division KSB1 bacterium]|nr:response regulator [candidate division KSB1 bacterium]
MQKIIIILLLISVSVYLNNVHSQQAIKFKHLKVQDGLSQSWVRCIHQDWQGFLWFGTADGLNKYDGDKITTYYYDFKKKNNLSSSSIYKIYEDKNNNLWIGTEKGINFYDRANDQFIHRSHWPQGIITSFLELDDGQFFIATRDKGMWLFHPDSGLIKSYVLDATDSAGISNIIEVLLKDSRGNIWVGTANGLSLFNPAEEKFITFRKDDTDPYSLSDNFIGSLLEDKNGRIWVGTVNNGLNLLKYEPNHPEKSRFTRIVHNPEIKTSISTGAVTSLLEDRAGYLWIGTENGGLNFIDLNNFQEDDVIFHHYRFNPFDNNSLSSNSIYSLFEDRDGGIWIGSNGDGINYYHPLRENFIHIKQQLNNPNSLNNNFVNVFYEEGDSLWIGTEGGVNLYNKKDSSYRHFVNDPNDDRTIGSNAVWAIYKDSRNNLWFGTWAGGLNLFNRKTGTFIRFKHDNRRSGSIPSNNIFAILEDRDRNLWIGTMGGGLCQFDYKSKTFKSFNQSDRDNSRITNNWIFSLLEDSYGQIWISTSGAVDVFNPASGTFKHFTHDTSDIKSISDNIATFLFEDSQKNLWFGTGNGLNVFNRAENNFDCYTKVHGLPNNQIKGILEDAQGNLWISTNKGLSRFIQGTKRPEKPIFKNYDFDDGLQGNEFTNRSCWRGHDGRMYFGGNNGFNVFHPDSIKENFIVSSVIFTNFLINNKPVLIGTPNSPLPKHISLLEEVKLNHKKSIFSIEYAMLNYLSPNKNQYAFMLEGFETDWNYVGVQRQATYTNLQHGEYIFRVKGTIDNKSWNQNVRSLKIIIIPPWWKTVWAYLFYTIFSGLLIWGIWRFQLNKRAMKHELMLEHEHAQKLEELNAMKSRFFSNITHEFRSPLTLIIGPMKQFLASNAKENFVEIAQMTLRNSERLYQLINQILELSKLEAGRVQLCTEKVDFVPFVHIIMLSFASLAERRKIALQFIAPDDLKTCEPPNELFIDTDKIQKVMTNLIYNALKFTPENGHVTVSVKKVINHSPELNQAQEDRTTSQRKGFWSRVMARIQNGLNDKNQINHHVQQKLDKHGYLEISVKDDGIGIREEDLNRIFDRFCQVADPRSGMYESTGIGLALAKELVELHSGTIHVESIYEHGTEFFVRLPLGTDHLNPSEISNESHVKKPAITIPCGEENEDDEEKSASDVVTKTLHKLSPILLIVDDNTDLRQYINDHLREEYQIIVAKDGKEGLDKAIHYVPDLIVSDVVMPNMNGIELCAKIKRDELTSHIPVILLTVRSSHDFKIEGLEIGADDYITKPFEIEELKARIRNLIELRRQLRKKFSSTVGLKPSDIVTNSADKRFIEKALSLIEKKMSIPTFGVEELADAMALSRVQLYRKIRAITGQTTAEFIRSIRLNRAAQLLKQQYDNIGQIAYEVGFSNPSYFSITFHKQFGMYPTEYVKKFK